ncbi:MAG: chaperone modulator CbpM [Pseudomonadota bacterium]
MIKTFEAVIAEVDIGASELQIWIEQNWVLPVEQDGEYLFDQSDVARVHLIAELRQDLGVNDEAIPVVLRLLDQIYGLRKALTQLNDGIKKLPESCRDRLERELRAAADE